MIAPPTLSPPRPDHLVLRFVLVAVVAVAVGLLSTLALAALNPRLFAPTGAPTAILRPAHLAPEAVAAVGADGAAPPRILGG